MKLTNEIIQFLAMIDVDDELCFVIKTAGCYPHHPKALEYGCTRFRFSTTPKYYQLGRIKKRFVINEDLGNPKDAVIIECHDADYIMGADAIKPITLTEIFERL